MQVSLFAHLQDIAGAAITVRLPKHSLAQAIFPALTALDEKFSEVERYTRLAVNDEWARPDQALHDGDAIALIPPVSGG